MTDLQNNKEMIAVGHEFARTLSSDTPIIEIAKMITLLAGSLDCVTLALREMTKQRDSADQAERVWERTMMDACGEDGPKSVADKFAALEQKLAVSQREFRAADATIENLQMKLEKLAAENAGLKDEISNITFMRDDDFFGSTQRAQEVMGRLVNVKTPETDAFLAEVRAQAKADGVEEYADSFRHSASKIRECHGDTIRVRALLHEANNADEFAAQLRKGVQS